MNSTETDLLLGSLFDEVLMPIAAKMREAGIEAFPRTPDVSWLSYYVRRKHSAMTADDFQRPACNSSAELEARLAAHWQALGRHELAAQAAQFAQAADCARREREAGAVKPVLSPYVYAMF
jgi:hypothetical protein